MNNEAKRKITLLEKMAYEKGLEDKDKEIVDIICEWEKKYNRYFGYPDFDELRSKIKGGKR